MTVALDHVILPTNDQAASAAFHRGVATLRFEQLPHWADPGHNEEGAINHRYGGRGVYFSDPGGNNLELLTRSMALPTHPPSVS
jgi:hypothetical protein